MTKRLAFLLVLLLASVPSLAAAQTLTGTIAGTVADAQGAVLPGVTVTITGRTGSQSQPTDAEGVFRFLALSPGIYSVRAELQGFRPHEENVDVAVGRTATL